jgi:hypothetical protein
MTASDPQHRRLRTPESCANAVRAFLHRRRPRPRPPPSREALARAVVSVPRLALLDGPIVTEAEINPLIVFRHDADPAKPRNERGPLRGLLAGSFGS